MFNIQKAVGGIGAVIATLIAAVAIVGELYGIPSEWAIEGLMTVLVYGIIAVIFIAFGLAFLGGGPKFR